MDFIKRWTYKLTGKKIPVFRVADVGSDGLVKSLILAQWVDRPNSILETWNVIGAEKSPNHEGMMNYTDTGGLTQPAYAEYKGRTCNLYVQPRNAPNMEKVIGSGAMLDDIAESMDMGRSMRNLLIGVLIGIVVGWTVIGPMMNAILS
jgi:hypothetical protein